MMQLVWLVFFSSILKSGAAFVIIRSRHRGVLSRSKATGLEELPLEGLKVAIVGAGPSGLLLAHKVLEQGATAHIYESRKDPRSLADLEGRAYALGLGIRARTAIRSVDDALWDSVKASGFESEKFTLYLRTLPIKLRDGSDDDELEPSVLIYQLDLCAALLDELERRHSGSKLSINFDQLVSSCDLQQRILGLENERKTERYDIIVGCDGVNSVVRSSINDISSSFTCAKKVLPGNFKVCRLSVAPAKLDPTTVALIVPKSGSTTAFVEPTVNGCCVLFAGSEDPNDLVLNTPSNLTVTALELKERFPILDGVDFGELARQLADQKPGRASSIQCNAYHYNSMAALCGDAAHATGGVSGQGVNCAFVDSAVLSDCLAQYFDASDRDESLNRALLRYSQRQVPEGKSLYDLSFGPKPQGLARVKFLLGNILDALFKGRFGIGNPPLQTLLTTTLIPFAELRRERDSFYDEPFPAQSTFDKELEDLFRN